MSEPCEACGGEGQHRRGGGACLERQVEALRAESSAAWARGLSEGLTRQIAALERLEAQRRALWRALKMCVAEWDDDAEGVVSMNVITAAREALGEEPKEVTP